MSKDATGSMPPDTGDVAPYNSEHRAAGIREISPVAQSGAGPDDKIRISYNARKVEQDILTYVFSQSVMLTYLMPISGVRPVKLSDLSANTENCSICEETYRPSFDLCDESVDGISEGPIKLYCGHTFGHKCIRKWFAQGKTSCPLCRVHVVPGRDTEGPKLTIMQLEKLNSLRLAGNLADVFEVMDVLRPIHHMHSTSELLHTFFAGVAGIYTGQEEDLPAVAEVGTLRLISPGDLEDSDEDEDEHRQHLVFINTRGQPLHLPPWARQVGSITEVPVQTTSTLILHARRRVPRRPVPAE